MKLLAWLRKTCNLDGKAFNDEPKAKMATAVEQPLQLNARCDHPKAEGKFSLHLFGENREFEGAYMCPDCLKKYLEANSTFCDTCAKPIFPGEAVANSNEGCAFPFTHINAECSVGDTWIGTWGEGKFLPRKSLAATTS